MDRCYRCRLAESAVLGLLVSLGGTLASPAGEPAKAEPLRDYLTRAQYRQAYGVYFNTNKLGWALDELKPGTRDSQDVAVESFEVHATIKVGGATATTTMKSVTDYSLEGDGPILHAVETTSMDRTEVVHTATREGDGLRVVTRAGGEETVRRVPLPKTTLALARDLERWLNSSPPKGARFEAWTASWEDKEIDQREVMIYRGKTPILWGGVKTDVHRVTVETEGISFDCEVAPNGRFLRGKVGGVFEIRAEEESLAKDLNQTGTFDLLKASAIKVDTDLGRGAQVQSLRIEARGVGDFRFPESHRQKVASRSKDKVVLDLRRDFRSNKARPLKNDERQTYLESTAALQSDHEEIRRLAREILDGEQDPLKGADLLRRWVHRNLKQTMAANAARALDVLRQRAGDCTEHSLLFTALARAAGIPARQAGGVAFVNNGEPLFGWHEWAEIHDGHQWVSVDPMWDQLCVDATHVKFSDGPEDWSWLRVLGRIEFRVLRHTPR